MTIFYFFIFLIITHAQLECINMTMQIFKRERICYLFGTAFERQQHYKSLQNSFRLVVHRNTARATVLLLLLLLLCVVYLY